MEIGVSPGRSSDPSQKNEENKSTITSKTIEPNTNENFNQTQEKQFNQTQMKQLNQTRAIQLNKFQAKKSKSQ